MKISHELPLNYLIHSFKWNDYEYCLPHLLDEEPEYEAHFRRAKQQGRYIVMDNSLHELGEAYNHDRLHYWIHQLKPNEFIVPDVWENKTHTLVQAKQWFKYNYPENTKLVAVVQAQEYHEASECYDILKTIGYQKIAFSYGASYYNDVSPHPNKFLGKALGRLTVISKLYERKIISRTDKVHLLGCAVPQEFGWYKGFPFIESIDTSNPVMAALDGIKYDYNGLLIKPESNMNNSLNVGKDKETLALMRHNIDMFRKINGLNHFGHYDYSVIHNHD
jgi:hypothetical protein